MKTIFVPSGDHEAAVLLNEPRWLRVSCTRPLPSVRTENTFDGFSAAPSGYGVEKRMRVPSGEQSIPSILW